jgi:hypothetical protein
MSTSNLLAGINIDLIGVGKSKGDILDSIIMPFNRSISRLMRGMMKYDDGKTVHIQKAKDIINVVKKTDPLILIRKSYIYLTNEDNKEALLNKDIEYFMNKDYDDVVEKGKWEETIYFVIDYIKYNFENISSEEQSEIWELLWVMLICSECYHKYIHNKY